MEPEKPNSQNLILAFALSFLVIAGWQLFFGSPWGAKENAEPQQTQNQAQENPQVQGEALAPNVTGQNDTEGRLEVNPTLTPATSATAIAVNRENLLKQEFQQGIRIPVNNSQVTGSIGLLGGKFDDLTLLNYTEELDKNSPKIHLFNPQGTKNPYHANFLWLSPDSKDLPNAKSLWKVQGNSELTPKRPVTLYWVNRANIRFEKIFALDENYMMNVTQRVINNSNQNLSIHPYGLVARTGTPETENFYILHEGFLGVLNQELIEEDYDDIAEENQEYKQSTGWFGISDKYWLAALIPQDSNFTASFKFGGTEQSPIYQADFYGVGSNLAPGQSHEYRSLLFVGAKEVALLDKYAEQFNIFKFDLGVDFGILYFITKPIFLLIKYFSGLFGNFGVAILALTVVIKIVFFPLANHSYVSISKMKKLQPQMAIMKERYGDDKQKLQQEMLKIYREKKINPMAGCIPILLQIPVFFALYKVLFVTIEMRHAPFFGWIQDLSAPDPLGILTLFGLISWNVPSILAVVNIGIWPILMGITMWIQQKLNPAPPDPIQQKVFAMLPFIFTFLLGTFPAGLVIYWTCNNSLTILQQWIITRRTNKEPL